MRTLGFFSVFVGALVVSAFSPSMAHAKYSLYTEIEISAPQEKVWAVVSDIASYEQWNPFIRYAHGTLEKGNFIEVQVQPSGAKPMKGKGKVLVLDPLHEMVWAAKLLGSWIFKGEHHFAVEPLPGNKSKFVQREDFTGILVPLVKGKINRETKHGFEEMNAALKARVEGK
jgi:hypothetical protein